MKGFCTWTPAKPPQGIAPQAFSWWDCKGQRRYGYPWMRVCNECAYDIKFATEPTDIPPERREPPVSDPT
jgi:hypothetical protein